MKKIPSRTHTHGGEHKRMNFHQSPIRGMCCVRRSVSFPKSLDDLRMHRDATRRSDGGFREDPENRWESELGRMTKQLEFSDGDACSSYCDKVKQSGLWQQDLPLEQLHIESFWVQLLFPQDDEHSSFHHSAVNCSDDFSFL
jgi:hypothetical protein